MAKTLWQIIFATSVVSAVSIVVTIVSVCTDHWVTAKVKSVKPIDFNEKPVLVNYGLFSGTWSIRNMETPLNTDITLLCIYSRNKCAFVTSENMNDGEQEFREILDGKICIKAGKNYTKTDENKLPVCSKKFINAGLWLSTITFLGAGLLLSAFAAVFGIFNTKSNPIYAIFNICGLYIWNGSAAVSYLMAMVLWAAQFGFYIEYNVGFIETLKGTLTSDRMSSLGYSFWILVLPLSLHICNKALLYWRQYLIDKKPLPFKPDLIQTDGAMIIY